MVLKEIHGKVWLLSHCIIIGIIVILGKFMVSLLHHHRDI